MVRMLKIERDLNVCRKGNVTRGGTVLGGRRGGCA